MVESQKAKKIPKPLPKPLPEPPKKTSKWPLYVFIVSVIIIFSLLGIGIYYSIGTVSSSVILMVVVILVATILIEFILKRSIIFGGAGRYERIEESAKDESDIKAPKKLEEKP